MSEPTDEAVEALAETMRTQNGGAHKSFTWQQLSEGSRKRWRKHAKASLAFLAARGFIITKSEDKSNV